MKHFPPLKGLEQILSHCRDKWTLSDEQLRGLELRRHVTDKKVTEEGTQQGDKAEGSCGNGEPNKRKGRVISQILDP